MKSNTHRMLALLVCTGIVLLVLSLWSPAQSSIPHTVKAQGTVETFLIFQSNRDGNDEIYRVDLDGSNPQRLTNNIGADVAPAVSPDGKQIAFSSSRDGNYDIYVMNNDGTNIRNLTDETFSSNLSPEWSPDGSQIVFTSDRSGPYGIYVMDASDGSGVTNIFQDDFSDANTPAWSPDGASIAFSSDFEGNQEIYVMDTNGDNVQNMTNDPQGDWHPDWSPDGNSIAFLAQRDGNHEIYVMNTDGTGLQNLTNTDSNEWKPAWSPDGSRIAFSTDRDTNGDGTENEEIYVMNADGTSVTRVVGSSLSDQFAVWIEIDTSIEPTATPTATPSATATATSAPDDTATPTPTMDGTATPTGTPTNTPTGELPTATPTPSPSVTPTPQEQKIAESADFATLSLRDAWDMSQFSDISQYLNRSGQASLVSNVSLDDGVFKATSVEANSSLVTLLMPGYSPATMSLDGDGRRNPIPSSYSCLYFAMKVHSGPVQAGNPDQYQVYWYEDSRLGGGANGLTYGLVHTETEYSSPGVQPANNWKLFRVNLANPANGSHGNNAWSTLTQWEGLMLRPINQGNTVFEIDWARLTPCQTKTYTVRWTPDANVNAIWVRPDGTTRDIRVAPLTEGYPSVGIDGNVGTYDLDTQGLNPGTYQVGLGTLTTPPTTWLPDTLTINQSPIVTFEKPSYYSGEDYATQQGNAWDFTDESDVKLIQSQVVPGALQYSFVDNKLKMISPSGPQPAGIDTQIYLNVPQPINGSDYRFMTFRMYTEWHTKAGVPIPWANGPHGMIGRWIWTIPSLTGQPGYECTLVGEDIPFDIYWQTYTVDLFDTLGGMVEEMSPANTAHCYADRTLINWRKSSNIIKLRFDPNENISEAADTITGGGPFTQWLDWIKLTKLDQVTKGNLFPIKVALNKALESSHFKLYYTDDVSQPFKYAAVVGDAPTYQYLYLPMVSKPTSTVISAQKAENGVAAVAPSAFAVSSAGDSLVDETIGLDLASTSHTFWWNTASVPAGEYHICATVNDGINEATYCSKAPMKVVE